MTLHEALEVLKRMNERLIKTFGNNENESTQAITRILEVPKDIKEAYADDENFDKYYERIKHE